MGAQARRCGFKTFITIFPESFFLHKIFKHSSTTFPLWVDIINKCSSQLFFVIFCTEKELDALLKMVQAIH